MTSGGGAVAARGADGDVAVPGVTRESLSQRARDLQRYAFARASEEPFRRRPSDVMWLVVALVVLGLAGWHQSHPTDFESRIFTAVNELPDSLEGLVKALYQIGSLWGLALIVGAGLVARRWRLTRDLAIAGFGAWVIGRFLAVVVGSQSVGDAVDVIVRGDATPSYPLVRLAVITAIVGAASPYVSRATRWIGIGVLVFLTLDAMYLGVGFPMDIAGGLALGVAAASIVHLVFGSPGGRPTIHQVELALASLGVDAHDVHLAPVQDVGRTLMLAVGRDGPLHVTVLGRDERDARLAGKVWRFVFYRDSGPTFFWSRSQEVEHGAYILLRATRAGVAVPEFVEVGVAGPEAALLVTRGAPGAPLASMPAERIDDALLTSVWESVKALHDGNLAHGSLGAENVLVGDDGTVVLTRLEAATSPATPSQRGADVAALLATTAELVGLDRAIDAAANGLGTDALAASIPYLQPTLIPRRARKGVHDLKKSVDAARASVAARCGVEEPKIEQLRRVTLGQAFMFALTILGVWLLIGVIGSPKELWETIKSADPAWIVVGFACWVVVEIGYSISMLGAIPPDEDVPFGPLTLLQVASAFLNLVTSGMVAQFVMNTRFLGKRGISPTTAVSASAIPPIGYTVIQILLLVITASAAQGDLNFSQIGGGTGGGSGLRTLLIIVLAVAVVVGIIVVVPKLRAKVVPPVKSTLHDLWGIVTSPRKVVYIFGGSLLTQLFYAFILGASLAAFGEHLSLAQLIYVNTFVSLFGGLIPVPGGMGVFEAGLTAGLTAMGIPASVAGAAVIIDRLITAYAAPVWGWIAMQWLTKHDYL